MTDRGPVRGPGLIQAVNAQDEAPLLTVVIVTYNSAAYIGPCLESLLPQVPTDGSRVVVVDNASSDGTAELVERRWPDVQVIRSEVNLGFGRACNLGAASSDTVYVVLLNPDTTVQAGCLDALVDVARRRPEAGLYGGRTMSADGTSDPRSCWGRPTLWSLACFACGLSSMFPSSELFNPEGIGGWRRDRERQVDVVSGCLLLTRRDLWQRLGGFDERFFMYGEDADLSIRASALGYMPVVTPAAALVHLVSASSAAVDKEILLFRGKATLVRKIWTGLRQRLAVFLLLTGVAVRARMARGVRSLLPRPDRPDRRAPASTWSEVWRRRGEWSRGW